MNWTQGKPPLDREGYFVCEIGDGLPFAVSIININADDESKPFQGGAQYDDGGIVPHYRWDTIQAYIEVPQCPAELLKAE